ncbi:MAG TPA: hypothetical protein VF690_06600 [Hymenobacter sp.]|jgi:hypothetical protein
MKHPLLFLLLAMLGACQGKTEEKRVVDHKQDSSKSQSPKVNTASAQPKDKLLAAQSGVNSLLDTKLNDTLQIARNIVLRIIPGSKADIPNAPATESQHLNESYYIRKEAAGRVSRKGHRLIFTLDNGKTVLFTDDTHQIRGDEDEERDRHYAYRSNLPGLPYWIVDENIYEGQRTFLVNQKTGFKTPVYSDFTLSPDHGRLFAYYAGATYEADFHAIQLFAIDRQSVRLQWQRQLKPWAPSKARWLDNRTIAVKQLYPDSANGFVEFSRPSYARLVFPK